MIHDAIPEECSEFECAYLQIKKASVSLRPDKCKVIFEKITDRIFLGTYDTRDKREIVAGKQIASFLEQGFSVVMVSCLQDKQPEIIPGKNHNVEDINLKFNKILAARYGSS